ncbi:hypothetical protein JHK86_026491 [Glycine max]|nr:hypothetical protein JHK86_026491 [Glycine max]
MANNKTAFAKASCMALMVCIAAALGAPFLGAMAEFTCCEIKPVIAACGSYVKTGGNNIPMECCMAVRNLRDIVRRSMHTQYLACLCLQDVVKQHHHTINTTAYENLPYSCGVALPYHFTHDMDCNMELGTGFRDILRQDLMNEDSYVVRNFGGPLFQGFEAAEVSQQLSP